MNGSKMVWADDRASGKTIYLAKNAGDHLFAHVVRQETARRAIPLEREKVTLDISYSNELLKQMVAVLDQEIHAPLCRKLHANRGATLRPVCRFLNPNSIAWPAC